MCRSLLSPISSCSFSASSNSARIFASDSPTYLFRISGPFTTFGSCAFSAFPICRAISVFPQPGGPYSSMPRTCLMPILRSTSGGNTREANARRKMSANSLSRPPMPIAWKLNPRSNRRLLPLLEPPWMRIAASFFFLNSSVEAFTSWPQGRPMTGSDFWPSISMNSMPVQCRRSWRPSRLQASYE